MILNLDLKGLALQCNWPDGLSVPELVAVLTPANRSNYAGAYDWFMHQLDDEGFDARGFRVDGLVWARQNVRSTREHSTTRNLIARIAIGSLDELEDPEIARALAELVLAAAEGHAGSPFVAPDRSAPEQGADAALPILSTKGAEVRRRLIVAIAASAIEARSLWWAATQTPGLLTTDDFPWLVERSVDVSLPESVREKYAEIAKLLPWMDTVEGVEAWLRARTTEPIASRLPYPLMIELDGEEARKARRIYAEAKRSTRVPKRKHLRPPPPERVEQILSLSETKDPRYFVNLCNELTLTEDSTGYEFRRFLMETPGWMSASDSTRSRIVESAKRLLATPTDEPNRAVTEPLNSILPGYMPAIWLAMANDLPWIESRPTEWWRTWAWYIMRELHPYMVNEPEAPKHDLVRLLHAHAPDQVRENIRRLAKSQESESLLLLKSLLDVLGEIDDATLDDDLCMDLEQGAVPDDRVSDIAQFVLTRSSERALSSCMSLLNPDEVGAQENRAVQAAVALLQVRTVDAWPAVVEFLHRRADLAQRVLGAFAQGRTGGLRQARTGDAVGLATLAPHHIGQLVALLLEAFPPETDPRHDGAFWIGPSESARELRDLLISQLSGRGDMEAVEALRSLEQTYGRRYAWLRHPRARAERAYRLSCWSPISPSVVAQVLAAQSRRLLVCGRDVLDGLVAALEDYQRRLKHESPSELEDLWNQPTGAPPTPKHEERVSDKVCVAVRNYFRQFALAASREVQVFRRQIAASGGGAPGSEVDVLCMVPASGTVAKDRIEVPIEVKLAHNREAETAMRDQLFQRYMSQLGTDFGLYVVVWMGRGDGFRPQWKTPQCALAELEEQARQLRAELGVVDIRCFVLDASLAQSLST